MSTKTYFASTVISLTLPIGSKGYRHIAFEQLSEVGSVLVTSDKQLQNALEKDKRFGRLFKLKSEVLDADKKAGEKQKEEDSTIKPVVNVVTVTSIDDAQDYMVDKFGVSRTKLRTVEEIKAEAEKAGIAFEGI